MKRIFFPFYIFFFGLEQQRRQRRPLCMCVSGTNETPAENELVHISSYRLGAPVGYYNNGPVWQRKGAKSAITTGAKKGDCRINPDKARNQHTLLAREIYDDHCAEPPLIRQKTRRSFSILFVRIQTHTHTGCVPDSWE